MIKESTHTGSTKYDTIWEEIAAMAKRLFGTEEEPELIPVKVKDSNNRLTSR
ncbi:hypothetical protein ACJD0Z_18030 [Flavobacteriaceae bacterium M23B6Z8]